MKRISILALFLAAATGFADAPATAPAERDRIRIDLARGWEPIPFSPTGVPVARNFSMDLTGRAPKFTCADPGRRASFEYSFQLPFEMTQHPIMVLKYRAKNIDTTSDRTCFWIMEGTSAATFPLVDFDKLTSDGQEHEIQIDLPKAPTGSKGTPFGSGDVHGIDVSVLPTQAGEGTIELIDLEFRSETDPPAAAIPDAVLLVRVLDEKGNPIRGATINVDPERKNAVTRAISDADGKATLTPTANEKKQHSIEIIAAGQVTVERAVRDEWSDPIEIQLPRPMTLGGVIEDDRGRPIKGARVSVSTTLLNPRPDPNLRVRYSASVRTDAQGQWLTPPVIYQNQIVLKVSHPDFASDDRYRSDLAPIDELRSGIAHIQLRKE